MGPILLLIIDRIQTELFGITGVRTVTLILTQAEEEQEEFGKLKRGVLWKELKS